MSLRVYRVPFSTNVERVALAAAYKGVEIEWVDVDPDDRAVLEQVSGQRLVPVLEVDGQVIADSPVILRWLEEHYPDPPLWPSSDRGRAETGLFVDWFNRTWKRPPNDLAVELAKAEPDPARVERLGAAVAGYVELFEGLLEGRDYLLGDFSVADVIAFPFLKYAVDRTPGDTDLFHHVLREWMNVDDRPRLVAWIERIDALPRA
ncbi:MAG TPA: glutathione S-transferase family protein [Gaiellaceae bacterium]|nr:glutathione S-transferase family protein [Gaiellaceae bacterium]